MEHIIVKACTGQFKGDNLLVLGFSPDKEGEIVAICADPAGGLTTINIYEVEYSDAVDTLAAYNG